MRVCKDWFQRWPSDPSRTIRLVAGTVLSVALASTMAAAAPPGEPHPDAPPTAESSQPGTWFKTVRPAGASQSEPTGRGQGLLSRIFGRSKRNSRPVEPPANLSPYYGPPRRPLPTPPAGMGHGGTPGFAQQPRMLQPQSPQPIDQSSTAYPAPTFPGKPSEPAERVVIRRIKPDYENLGTLFPEDEPTVSTSVQPMVVRPRLNLDELEELFPTNPTHEGDATSVSETELPAEDASGLPAQPAAEIVLTIQPQSRRDLQDLENLFPLAPSPEADAPSTRDTEFFPEDVSGAPEESPTQPAPEVVVTIQPKLNGNLQDLEQFFPLDPSPEADASSARDTEFFPEDASGATTESPAHREASNDLPGPRADDTEDSAATEFVEDPFTGLRLEPGGFEMPLLLREDDAPVSSTQVFEPAPFVADSERPLAPEDRGELGANLFVQPSSAIEITQDTPAAVPSTHEIGIEGYCPVTLREERTLVQGNAKLNSVYHQRTYRFATAAAKMSFDADPHRYAPVAGGLDVTLLSLTGEKAEGTLKHAIWYQGHLHLFSTAQMLETFIAAPDAMSAGR